MILSFVYQFTSKKIPVSTSLKFDQCLVTPAVSPVTQRKISAPKASYPPEVSRSSLQMKIDTAAVLEFKSIIGSTEATVFAKVFQLPGLVLPDELYSGNFRKAVESLYVDTSARVQPRVFRHEIRTSRWMKMQTFLDKHEDPDASCPFAGRAKFENVHPMNVIDFNLNDPRCCFEPNKVQLPAMIEERSLGHILQSKFLLPDLLLTYSHSKYLLLGEPGSVTDWHQDMTGSAVFYMVLSGHKEFHIIKPTSAVNDAVRTLK